MSKSSSGINFKRLKEPFPQKSHSFRLQSCGKKNGKFWAMCLVYIQSRDVQDRLDFVVGPENWRTIFRPIQIGSESGVECTIEIKINGEWIGKTDVAPTTDVEKLKGAYSDAFKRAAVHWGIGRYLYDFEAIFAEIVDKAGPFIHKGQTKDKEYFLWKEPILKLKAKDDGPIDDPEHPDFDPIANESIMDHLEPKRKNGPGNHQDQVAPTYPADEFDRINDQKKDPNTKQKRNVLPNKAPVGPIAKIEVEELIKTNKWSAKSFTKLMKMVSKDKVSDLTRDEFDFIANIIKETPEERFLKDDQFQN